MKVLVITSVALLAAQGFAFPSTPKSLSKDDLEKINELAARITAETKVKRTASPGFDAKAQWIDTTGVHAWAAPGPNDLRGPCPGMNSLANHGYIPRNGIVSMVDLINASVNVFGMGIDFATFLAAYTSVMAGDLTSFSIGGSPKTLGFLSALGLLSAPTGLSGSHNRFEADVSPTRKDLYKPSAHGDAVSMDISLFEALYAMPLGPRGYDLTALYPVRGGRFNDSVATNPYFWYGPVTGLAVNTAAYSFIYRFFANHTAAYPEGYLDGETLKSFYSVTGQPGSFKWTAGHERIPDCWYRRAIGDEYGIVPFALDAVAALQNLPYMAVLGGNTGTPNSFTGVSASDLTGGIYNTKTLLQGNNALCLAFQAVSMGTPGILRGLVSDVAHAVGILSAPLAQVVGTLGCPQLAKFDTSLFTPYPGCKGGL